MLQKTTTCLDARCNLLAFALVSTFVWIIKNWYIKALNLMYVYAFLEEDNLNLWYI